jgi:DNA ligase D
MAKGDDTEILHVAGRDVRITNPDKVMFPERGETKLDLARYYLALEAPFLAATQGRPLLLQRFPDGALGGSFFQKRVAPTKADPWLTTTEMATPNGTTSQALVAVDMAHVLWAVNMGCLGFHVWPTTAADPGHADELRIDLDPSPGVDFEMIREAAAETKALFDELGIAAHPKTTGNRGIHVYARLQPRWDSYDVRLAAVAVARELERRRPDLLTAAWWKEERGTRVFIDFNQNAPHKTVFGAWCARANAHGQVSAGFRWDELEAIQPKELTIATVPARVAAEGDPWAEMDDHRQDLEPALELHRRDRADGIGDLPWPPVYPKMPHEPPRVAPSRAKRDPVER